jgi:cytochrome o ubiquinol oxidase operon protein cyoD
MSADYSAFQAGDDEPEWELRRSEAPGPGDHAVHAARGTLKTYLTGFLLSAVLTTIPFSLVMTGALAAGTTAAIVVAVAVTQILVHMVYFLHLNARSENGWNLLAAIFTIVLVAIMIGGALWVMYQMNLHMMPTSPPGDVSGM